MRKSNFFLPFLCVFIFLCAGKALSQTAYTITYQGLTGNVAATGVPTGITIVTPYTGVTTSCATSSNGANTFYSLVLKAAAGYSFTITSVGGTAYASSAGSRDFSFKLVNGSYTQTSATTSIPSSSSCAGSAPLTPLAVAVAGQTVPTGTQATITVLRAPGAGSGGGYSWTKTLTVSGVVTQDIVAPVALKSFTGKANNNYNTLEWATINELNFSHYELERSESPRDFITIKKIAAKGAGTLNNYQHKDQNISTDKTLYYRLKMVDIDGSFKHSNIVVLKHENSALNIKLYPNPSQSTITVEGLKGNTFYNITDAVGKKILQGNAVSAAQVNIDISSLQRGLYFLHCIDKTGAQVVTFVKE